MVAGGWLNTSAYSHEPLHCHDASPVSPTMAPSMSITPDARLAALRSLFCVDPGLAVSSASSSRKQYLIHHPVLGLVCGRAAEAR